jgi:hypothetical protein
VPQQVSETSTDSTPVPSADGLRVLVVEDDALIRLDLT